MTYASVNLKALSALLQCKGFDLEGATFVDPAENRKSFREFSKGRCGVYVWQAAKGNTYVGRSTNLYTRIRSYFLPSVLKRKDQRVIFFFNKHGFKGVVLHILRLPSCTSIETLINLEQEVLDEIKPRLNVEPFVLKTVRVTRNPLATVNKVNIDEVSPYTCTTSMAPYCTFLSQNKTR